MVGMLLRHVTESVGAYAVSERIHPQCCTAAQHPNGAVALNVHAVASYSRAAHSFGPTEFGRI